MRTDDRGETLLELLVAVVVMGIAVVAIVGGLATSILVSDYHRKQSTAGEYVRDYAEVAESLPYKPCALPADYAGFTAPSGFTATPTAIRYWNAGAWSGTCASPDSGLQQLAIQVASADGRATERVTVVLRKACGPGSSC